MQIKKNTFQFTAEMSETYSTLHTGFTVQDFLALCVLYSTELTN